MYKHYFAFEIIEGKKLYGDLIYICNKNESVASQLKYCVTVCSTTEIIFKSFASKMFCRSLTDFHLAATVQFSRGWEEVTIT